MDEGNEIIQKRSIAGIILIVIAVLSLLIAFMNNISFLPYCVISGIAGIYFFKTKSGPIYKKNELAFKIAFYILSAIELIFGLTTSNFLFIFALISIIVYSIGAPWGKQGYKTQEYSSQEPKIALSKKWWFYLSSVALGFLTIVFVLAGFAQTSEDNSSKSNEPSSGTPTSTSDDKYIRLDGHKIYYTASKKYSTSGSADTSWSAATADVNNVTVYKVESGYTYGSKRGGKKVQGMVAINVKVKALKDITVNMDSATVSIPSIDEQHDIETKDDWDDQDKGITRTGTLYVPIYKMHSINSIKSLRLKFECNKQDTDDANDFDHTYDMTIDLSK